MDEEEGVKDEEVDEEASSLRREWRGRRMRRRKHSHGFQIPVRYG